MNLFDQTIAERSLMNIELRIDDEGDATVTVCGW